MIEIVENGYLEHHGIRGMKWGIRKYQNEDGTLTPAGKARYHDDGTKLDPKHMTEAEYDYAIRQYGRENALKNAKRQANDTSLKRAARSAMKVGVTVAGAYATFRLSELYGEHSAGYDTMSEGQKRASRVMRTMGAAAISGIVNAFKGGGK